MSTDWLDDIPYEHERPKPHAPEQPRNTLAGIARWLAHPTVLEFMRKHELGRDFHDEIKAAVERCRVAIERPQDKETRTPLGPHEGCGGQVMALLPPEGKGEASAECECGQKWTALEMPNLARHLLPDDSRPVWVSTAYAAGVLGVSDRTVRGYAQDGRLRCDVRSRGKRRIVMVRQSDVTEMQAKR